MVACAMIMGLIYILPRGASSAWHGAPKRDMLSLKLSDVCKCYPFTLVCSHVLFLSVANYLTRVVQEILGVPDPTVGATAVFKKQPISIPLLSGGAVFSNPKISPPTPTTGIIVAIAGFAILEVSEWMMIRSVFVAPAVSSIYSDTVLEIEGKGLTDVCQVVGVNWATCINGRKRN